MFWGLIMEPNEWYTQVVEKPFHISQAALDSTTGENTEPCQVMVVVDGKNFLVCTLQKSNCLQVPLDLYFKAGDSVSFLTNGKSNIHLTGYLDPEFEDDLEDKEEDDEEAPALVEPSKKTKLENAADQKSKKAKNEMLLMVGGERYYLAIGGVRITTVVGLVNGSCVVKADYPGENWGVSVTQGPAGKVVATGGEGVEGVSNTMFIYDVAEDRWTSGPYMSTPRKFHSSVTIGTKVYVIGGCDQDDIDLSSVEVWDWSRGESSAWEYVSPMGTDLSGAAAVVYKGDIYVTGGRDDNRSGEKYIVGNDTWVPIPDMVHYRDGHGLVTLGSKIFAIGGCNRGDTYLKSVESFDGVQWVEETSLNVGRRCAAYGVIGGELYVVGGFGVDGLVRSMEIFDPSTSKWTIQNITDTSLLPADSAGYVVVDLP